MRISLSVYGEARGRRSRAMTNAISGSIRTVAPMAGTGQADACAIVGAKMGARRTGRGALGNEHL